MSETTQALLDALICRLGALDMVRAAGVSGGEAPLPEAGAGDIDLFIYCTQLPGTARRQAVIAGLDGAQTEVFAGGRWGSGDLALINGVETWLMYFTMDAARQEVESILAGEQPGKEDNYFYPVGRLGMLQNMAVLLDKDGFLEQLQKTIAVYPAQLADTLTRYHLDALEDTEDLSRAANRGDALFYHFALDLALDHFLQALFAMNRTYFPSRKRSLSYIRDFAVKPEGCGERLSEILRLGGDAETVAQSFARWQSLAAELKALGHTPIAP